VDLEFVVPEDQVGGVPPGQEISITVSAYPQDTFSGTVTVTAPAVDPRNRSVRARATVTDPQTKLKAGMFAQVAVATSTRQDALLLPVEAVVSQADSTFTWLVVDGRAKRQTIRLGVRDDERVEVTDGLFDGAEVILNAPATITDGQAIDVQ
jgi:membrane fusion protein, multidrug efflux system